MANNMGLAIPTLQVKIQRPGKGMWLLQSHTITQLSNMKHQSGNTQTQKPVQKWK